MLRHNGFWRWASANPVLRVRAWSRILTVRVTFSVHHCQIHDWNSAADILRITDENEPSNCP